MSTKPKTPRIRFKGYTDAWEQRKLGELFNFQYGEGNINPSNGGEYPVYGAGGQQGSYTKYNAENSIIIGHMGDAGCVTWGKGKHFVTYNGTITTVKFNNFSMLFGYYSLLATDLRKLTGGSSLKFLTYEMIREIKTSIPVNEDEHKKIEELFFALDNLITLHQRKYLKLKNIKSAMLEKMFPKPGSNVPEIRFSGFTDAWEQRKLYEVATFLTGNGFSWEDITIDGERECVLYGNLYTDYGNITDAVKYKTNSRYQNETLSQFGDVLIPASDTTPTGLARATSLEKAGVLIGGDINIVRPNIKVNGSFLSLEINSERKQLLRLIKGSTVRHIHNFDIQNIAISLPKSSYEQTLIVAYFKNIDNLITLHQRKLFESGGGYVKCSRRLRVRICFVITMKNGLRCIKKGRLGVLLWISTL